MAEHRLIRLHQGHLQVRGTPDAWTARLADLWAERAAILEHEAGFPRGEAELRAFLEVVPPSLRTGAA